VGDHVVASLELGHPAPGERQHGVVAAGLGEVAQRLDGEVVVVLVEAVASSLGEHEHLGRAAAAAHAVHLRDASLQRALREQVVEVAADRGGGQLEPLRERRGRARAVLEDRPSHPLTRRGLVADRAAVDFHNIIVSLFAQGFN